MNLWRLAPALYYRMVQEVVRRSVAAHGPPTQRDFDAKLVPTTELDAKTQM